MENVMALSDFFCLVKRRSSSILKSAFTLGAVALLYTVTRPVLFQAEGTFRERKSSSDLGESQMALKWLSLGDEMTSNEAISWFKSLSARCALVKKFDLNAEVRGVRWFTFPTLRRVKEHMSGDFARLMSKQSPSLPRHAENLIARDVVFEGEAPLNLSIYVDSAESFSVYEGSRCLGKGRFLEPLQAKGFKFTLIKKGEALRKYSLTLWPVETYASRLKGMITAKSSSKDPSLVSLTLSADDRFLARDYLNGLMELYREHLRECHSRVIDAQVAYLKKRQAEMDEVLDQSMLEFVSSVSHDLAHSGFVNSEKAFAFLAEGAQKQKEKLFAIDLEIKRLREGKEFSYEGEYFAPLLAELRSLKQRRDSFKLSGAPPTLLKEYRGLTLATSQEFYLNLCRDLKELKSKEKLAAHALEEIRSEGFEVSSLSAVLQDPVGQKLVERGSAIRQALSDERNRTTGELLRLSQERTLVKELLKSHLEQTLSLLALEQGEVFKKIEEVQQVSAFLTEEQIVVLEKQLQEAVQEKLSRLEQERRLLSNQSVSLNRDLERVPSQWLFEKKLERHLLSNEKITAELSRLVESKNIASHLEVVAAGPEDLAIAPLHPKSAHLILFPLFGAFLGGGIALCALFLQAASGKTPVGKETLLLKGMSVCTERELIFQLMPFTKSVLFLKGKNLADSLSKRSGVEVVEINEALSLLQKTPDPKIYSFEALLTPEALALAKHFERVVITLEGETAEQLNPFFLMGKKFIFIFSTQGDESC